MKPLLLLLTLMMIGGGCEVYSLEKDVPLEKDVQTKIYRDRGKIEDEYSYKLFAGEGTIYIYKYFSFSGGSAQVGNIQTEGLNELQIEEAVRKVINGHEEKLDKQAEEAEKLRKIEERINDPSYGTSTMHEVDF